MNATFKQVASFQFSSEAIIVKGKLESEQIPVFMFDNYTIDTDPMVSHAIGGVKLFVKTEDFDKAVLVLESINKYAMTDDGKNISCPQCQGKKVDYYTTIKDIKSLLSFFFSLLLFMLPFYTKRKYKCTDCSFEFDVK